MHKFVILIACLLFTSPAFAEPAQWQAEGWKTDFSKLTVPSEEILSGGPPKDGIPPIDAPKFVPVSQVSNLADSSPVIGLEINGDARTYPLQVMIWHEIVNDKVGGKPVTVTYCPLCNAAIVFEASIKGTPVTFGTTGKLRNSDLIMYDRATESWWQQFTGTAIAGAMAGQKLKLVPARLESWKEFRMRHPGGKVLVPNAPSLRDYGRNPYVNYDTSKTPFLYKGAMPEGISPMARVVVVRRDNAAPFIMALSVIRGRGKTERDGLRISWQAGQASALHDAKITNGRDVGSVVVTDSATGKDLAYDVTFAFVAHAFHPSVAILQK